MTNINTFQGDVFIHEYIKHTGDDNNLFGFSGTDTFKIATAGTDRLTVDSSGNVGIGTGGPQDIAHIYKDGGNNPHGLLIENVNTGTGQATLKFGVAAASGEGTAVAKAGIFFKRAATKGRGDLIFCIDNAEDTNDVDTGNHALTIYRSGNVGVGTVTPGEKLHVHENISTSGHQIIARVGGDTSSYNTLILGSKEGRPHIGGHRGDFGAWADLALQNDVMVIQQGGNVGIGSVTPQRSLDINGQMQIAGSGSTSHIFMNNASQGTGADDFVYLLNAPRPGTSSGGAVFFLNGSGRSNDGGASTLTLRNDSGALDIGRNSQVTNINGSITQKVNGDSSFILFGPNSSYNSRLYVGATAGGPFALNGPNGGDAGCIVTNGNLHLDASGPASLGRAIYLNHYSGNTVVYKSTIVHGSDDRIKTQEKFIQNSLPIIKKLKPQTYLHHRELNSTDCRFSSGLIAQEVYYNCPELKHIVNVPRSAHVDLTKEFPDDPSIDPDYSDWGDEIAAVNYMEIIPYLIGAINQLSNEGIRHKVKVSNLSFSNVLEYHGLVVSKNSNVYISNIENDKRVYGVISDVKAETNDSEVLVNYRGNGKIWVINVDNIQAGDYITTSNVSGYAMKQEEDDTLKNYTIAKSSIDCDFTPPMIDEKRIVQTNTTTSRWKHQSNVLVSESTYSNISDDIRYIESRVMYKEIDGDNSITSDAYNTTDIITQNNYTQTTVTEYFYMSTRYLDYNPDSSSNLWIEESISKTVDSLDENGQVIWENTGTQVPLYPIKYITSSGTETDLSNAVYTAALIDCSILGG